MKKLILSLCLCIAMLLPYHTSAQAIYNDNNMPLDLVLNDTYVTLSLPLIEYQSTVYAPVRSLCELFGTAEYSWNDKKAMLTLEYEGKKVKVTEGETDYTVDGKKHRLSTAPWTVNGRLYVPIRFVEPVFGATVGWDANYYNVVIKKAGYGVPAANVCYYQHDSVFWLARIVHAESRGESDAGKLAVANVILNRVKSSQYPNTIFEVIFDRRFGVQYTPSIDGSIYNTPGYASIIAAKRALHGENNVGNSLFFYNPRIAGTNWIARNRRYYTTIGNHAFYL